MNTQNQIPIDPANQTSQTPINDQSNFLVQNTNQADLSEQPVVPPAVDNEDMEPRRQQIKQEQAQIDAMLEEIEQTNFDQLVTKYGFNHLCKIVLNKKPTLLKSVVDQYLVFRQFMVSDFIKPESMPTFPPKLKDKIIALIAALKPDENLTDIQTWLNQIEPNLVLPENFQVIDYQPRAYKLWQAAENIKRIIMEFNYNDSFSDIKKLLLLPDDKYTEFTKNINDLDQEIAEEYAPQKAKQPAKLELNNKILKVLSDFGRTPVFIQEQKKENNFGNLTEIFLKIAYAVQISESIKAKKLTQPISDDALKNEIMSYIYQSIILK